MRQKIDLLDVVRLLAFRGGGAAPSPRAPFPALFFLYRYADAAEDAVAVVILAVAGKLARREY